MRSVIAVTTTAVRLARKPNILFILAGHFGCGALICHRYQRFKTPNNDGPATEGMRFTAHQLEANICAAARRVRLSGKHPGHACIRSNRGGWGAFLQEKTVDAEGRASAPRATLKGQRLNTNGRIN